MNYRINPKNGDKLSALGYGCMRFPRSFDEVQRLVNHAIDSGVNYFDTAYIYPGNETTLGRALEGRRGEVKLATKLPHISVKTSGDIERIFNTQLEHLRTNYIDYYLIHMLSDVLTWERLCSLGILDWISEKKRTGAVINLGFSYHGGRDEFKRLIDAYDWDFCMIQYNYLDEQNQAGKSGLEYAAAKGLPVMIMEPLRGGTLVNHLPSNVLNVFHSADKNRTPADWALRWVWNHPEVTVVLSGMNSLPMLEENIKTATDMQLGTFSPEDLLVFTKARELLSKLLKVPCTGCGYCLPCPAGVDIPTCFACYNDRYISGFVSAMQGYLQTTSFQKKPSNASRCLKCGKCEMHCPQSIKIREELKNAKKTLEPFFYKPLGAVARKFMKL